MWHDNRFVLLILYTEPRRVCSVWRKQNMWKSFYTFFETVTILKDKKVTFDFLNTHCNKSVCLCLHQLRPVRFNISSKIYGPSDTLWLGKGLFLRSPKRIQTSHFLYILLVHTSKNSQAGICGRSLVWYSCVRRWDRISLIILWPKKPNYISNSIPKVIFGYLIIWVLWWSKHVVYRAPRIRELFVWKYLWIIGVCFWYHTDISSFTCLYSVGLLVSPSSKKIFSTH